jgi:hypothetical protein
MRSIYSKLIVEYVRSKGCVKKEVLLRYLAITLNKSLEEIDVIDRSIITAILKRLVEKGILTRAARGYYCYSYNS